MGHLGAPTTHFRGEKPRFPQLGPLPGQGQEEADPTPRANVKWGCLSTHPSICASQGPWALDVHTLGSRDSPVFIHQR